MPPLHECRQRTLHRSPASFSHSAHTVKNEAFKMLSRPGVTRRLPLNRDGPKGTTSNDIPQRGFSKRPLHFYNTHIKCSTVT